MKDIYNRWRLFLSENKRVIKEMHWHDASTLTDKDRNKLLNNLNKQAAGLIRKFDIIDFSLENEKIYKPKETGITVKTMKFFVPLDNNQELFFDFTSSDEHNVVREPTKNELREKGKSIPVLPKNWYEAHNERYEKKVIKEKKKKRDLSQVKMLAVFDFDETLFRSDFASKRLESDHPLSPKSLPDIPKESDWNLDIVYKAQELCSNPAIYCVMMTGRVGDRFKEKIDKLLQDRNIFFAETHYNEFGGNTAKYKTEAIYNILSKLPNVKRLRMWEDQQEKAEKYIQEFTQQIDFKIHMVG